MPEKNLNEIPRPLRELYEKGTAAWQRQNWDYAIAILTQVLQKEPAFFDCRKLLRATQHKKAEASKGFSIKRFFGSAGNSPQVAKGQIVLRNNPLEAIQIAEQILNGDPNSVAAHKLLAEGALEADLPQTAVLSLEIARKLAPNDKEIALRLGQAFIKAGQVAKAEHIYRELERSYPNDQQITQALKNAVANRTMSEGGYETISGGQGSYRDILKDKAEAVALEQEHREVKAGDVADQLIQEYQSRLVNEPGNIRLLRSVAELYVQKQAFDQALDAYRRIIDTEGVVDPAIERAYADTTAKKFDHALAQLDPASPSYPEERARIENEKTAYRITEAKQRVERYPTDLQLRFDLGQLYFESGKISEAIQEFQRAQSNPHIRTSAMKYLGQCFAKRGMNDIAARTFQGALKEKPTFDDEKKELVYLLGCVLESMGKKEEAIEQFKQIYEIDIGYQDVAAKVDAYYSGK